MTPERVTQIEERWKKARTARPDRLLVEQVWTDLGDLLSFYKEVLAERQERETELADALRLGEKQWNIGVTRGRRIQQQLEEDAAKVPALGERIAQLEALLAAAKVDINEAANGRLRAGLSLDNYVPQSRYDAVDEERRQAEQKTLHVVGKAIEEVEKLQTELATARQLFDEHTKAVGEFLRDMYSTMIDPCSEGVLPVNEMTAILLNAAVNERQAMADLQDKFIATRAELVAAQHREKSLLGQLAGTHSIVAAQAAVLSTAEEALSTARRQNDFLRQVAGHALENIEGMLKNDDLPSLVVRDELTVALAQTNPGSEPLPSQVTSESEQK